MSALPASSTTVLDLVQARASTSTMTSQSTSLSKWRANPMTRFISPNDLQKAAISMMLEGRPPASYSDWELCANFWAANIVPDLSEAILPIMGLMFACDGCDLTRSELIAIARFQEERRPKAPSS